MPHVIPPIVTEDDEYFWNGVAEGRLLLRRCVECGHLQHPPTPMCQKCGSLNWEVQEASGQGVVYSWIVSRHPTKPEATPRIVALVQLAEGVRVVANVQDIEPENVANDMPVELFFAEVGGTKLVQFRPATGAPTTGALS